MITMLDNVLVAVKKDKSSNHGKAVLIELRAIGILLKCNIAHFILFYFSTQISVSWLWYRM